MHNRLANILLPEGRGESPPQEGKRKVCIQVLFNIM